MKLAPLILLAALAACASPAQGGGSHDTSQGDSGPVGSADAGPHDAGGLDSTTADVTSGGGGAPLPGDAHADSAAPDATPDAGAGVDSDGAEDGGQAADTDTATGCAVPKSCDLVFAVKATSPVAQSMVALTGDFLSPGWPATAAKGAVALTLGATDNTWRATVTLPHGRVVAYKYTASWPDNPGPVWFNQAGEFEGSANSIRVVDCAAVACGAPSSRAALVAATLAEHGDEVRASQDLVGLGVGVGATERSPRSAASASPTRPSSMKPTSTACAASSSAQSDALGAARQANSAGA